MSTLTYHVHTRHPSMVPFLNKSPPNDTLSTVEFSNNSKVDIECLTSNCVTAAYLSLPSGVVNYWMSHLKLCDCCISFLALRGCELLNVSPQTVWPLRISPCAQGLCIIECLTWNCVTAAYLSLRSGLVNYWMSHLKLCDRCVSLLALRGCVLFNVSPQTVWPLRISPCAQGLCII